MRPLFWLLLFAAAGVSAEQIVLTDGGVRYGEIASYSGNYVQLQSGGAKSLHELTTIADVRIDPGLDVDAAAAQSSRAAILRQRINSQQQIQKAYRKKIRTHLENREFSILESEFQSLMDEETWPNDGTWISDSFFSAFENDLGRSNRGGINQRLKLVDEWQQAMSDSLAAAAAKVHLLVISAWAERGSGVNSTVTDEQRQKYKTLLRTALEMAYEYSDQQMTPAFYAAVMRAAKGYGLETEHKIAWLQVSASYYPSYMPVFVELAVSLMPKWGGSYQAANGVCDTASEMVNEARAAEIYYRCVLALEDNMVDREFHKYPFDWSKVVQGFDDYQERYQETEADFYMMAKMAALGSNKQYSQGYFGQTSGEWNHFAKAVWFDEKKLQRFVDWANADTDPTIQQSIIDALNNSKFAVALNLYRQYKGYADQINAINLLGESVIHSASRTGQFELLDLALQEGGDPNLLDGYGQTPLITAASHNELNSVYVLLRHGADPTVFGNGRTAAHRAAGNGYLDILKAMAARAPEILTMKSGKGDTPLHYAISKAQLETVNYMLKQPQVIEYVKNDDADWPALIDAAYYGQESIVRDLVALGADIGIRNKNGESALSIARRQGFTPIADYLESIGAPYHESGTKDPARTAANLFRQGKQAARDSKLSEARAFYLQSLEIDPNSEQVWSSLSMVSFWMKNYEEAVKQIDRAISINPDNAEHIYWKGRFYHAANRPDKYRALFREYVKRAPDTYNTVDLKTNYPQYLDYSLEYRALAGGLGILCLIGLLFYIRRRRRAV